MHRHEDNVCCSPNIEESYPHRDGRDMYYALGFEKGLQYFARNIYREETVCRREAWVTINLSERNSI